MTDGQTFDVQVADDGVLQLFNGCAFFPVGCAGKLVLQAVQLFFGGFLVDVFPQSGQVFVGIGFKLHTHGATSSRIGQWSEP